jgi:carboxylesterase type B
MKFLFLFSLFLFQLFAQESIIIRTPVGNIRGIESNGHRSFIGIPFAEKPQRWRAPVAKKQFTSVFNATQFGFICPQTRQWDPNFYPKQDEDCLNLNIWTPSHLKRNEKLPVVIYLYGGAFDFGISSRRNYRGNFVANSTNSIFVSLNYRVGSLGWLDGLDQNGNYGLMDQRLALEWIHKNIEFFGGDNKKITLIGQSAGAMSVLMHLISPRTNENLFQKVVFLGAPFSILYRNRDQNQPYMKMFAANLGCVLNDRKCYEAQPLAEIVKASSRTALIPTPPLLNSRNVLPWTPTIDGLDVPGQPLRLIREGKYKKNVQVIIGYNRDEAADFLLKAYDRPIPHWQYKTLATIWMGFHTPEVFPFFLKIQVFENVSTET